MPAFLGPDHVGSNEASQLLHPSAGLFQPPTIAAEVLADIAAGLAAAVDPSASPTRPETLLTTASYEAVLLPLPPDAAINLGGSQATAFAVVGGSVLAWTADAGCDLLRPGSSCAIEAGERVRVANFGETGATMVVALALTEVSGVTGAGRSRRFDAPADR